jgi:hypothetical protein
MSKSASLGGTLLLAATVAFGIATAWCVAVGWIVMVVERSMQQRDIYEQLLVGPDGEPVISRTSYSSGASEVVTLSGEPSRTTSQDLLYPQHIMKREQLDWYDSANWSYRLAGINDGGAPAVFWYLVHDGNSPGHAHGVGYHSKTKTIVGYFGRGGFREALPPRDDWFEIAGSNGLYGATINVGANEPVSSQTTDARMPLLANGKLWMIDTGQRQVKAVADCPTAIAVGQAWQLPREIPPKVPGAIHQPAQSTTPMRIVVRQPESLIVLDQLTDTYVTFPLPAAAQNPMLAAYLLGDGNLLLLLVDTDAEGRTSSEVIWLSSTGQVIKREPVRLAGQTNPQSYATVGWQAAAAAPAPLASALIVGLVPRTLVRAGQAESYAAGLRKVVGGIWLSVLAVLAIGAGCAAAAYRRQRRYGLPHPAAWAAFVFAGGIAGWIAYRFHRRWPVLEDCPACGEPAPRDREACLDCGAAFPPPPLKGIEVFA